MQDSFTTMSVASQQDETNTLHFLNSLYANAPSAFLACWRKRDKSSEFFPVSELDRAAKHLRSEPNIYYRVSLLDRQPPSGERGDASYTGTVVAFVADFDVYNPSNPGAHAKPKEELPQAVDEVVEFLTGLSLSPSVVVQSGNGLHAYWLFKRPVDVTPFGMREVVGNLMQSWQSYVLSAAKQQRGWSVDNVGDLARVLRAPGTINEKNGQLTMVKLILQSDARYGLEDFQKVIPAPVSPESALAPASLRGIRTASNDNDEALDLEQFKAGCAWIKHCFDDSAVLPEPEWYAALSIIAHCDESESLAQEMSKDHHGYDPAETAKKLAQAKTASGPRTCTNIEEKLLSPYCKKCPFRGKIKSPATLGRPENELVRTHGYLVPTQQFVRYETGQRLSKDQYNDKHLAEHVRRGRKSTPAKYLLSRLTLSQFDQIVYRPGQPPIGETTYNTWKRGGPLPEEGDVGPFEEHLEFVFPDEAARSHFLKSLAHTFQRPDRRIKHVLLVIGGAGVGKSYFTSYLLPLLYGKHNVSCIGPDDIKGSWTDWLAEKQIVIIEELMSFGQLETYNKLKPLITQETVRVNTKNIAHYDVDNTANFFCTSNHDNPIKIDPDDRRWWVYKSPAAARDPSYYSHLFFWTKSNLAAIAYFLSMVDTTDFNPDAPPPMTLAKSALIEVSREPLERVLREMIEHSEPPFEDRDLVLIRQIGSALRDRSYTKYTDADISRVLPKLGFKRLAREKKMNRLGTRESLRLWCRANQEKWEIASSQQCVDEVFATRIQNDSEPPS